MARSFLAASILIHSRSTLFLPHRHFYFFLSRAYLFPASITREIPLDEVRGIERVLNNSDKKETQTERERKRDKDGNHLNFQWKSIKGTRYIHHKHKLFVICVASVGLSLVEIAGWTRENNVSACKLQHCTFYRKACRDTPCFLSMLCVHETYILYNNHSPCLL